MCLLMLSVPLPSTTYSHNNIVRTGEREGNREHEEEKERGGEGERESERERKKERERGNGREKKKCEWWIRIV